MKELENLGFKLDTAYTKPTYIKFLVGDSIFSDGSIFIKVTTQKHDYKIQVIKIRSPRQEILKELTTSLVINSVKRFERICKNERID